MNKLEIYEEIKKIQELAWHEDDHMHQDTLFELQDRIADLSLALANELHLGKDLADSFPWLFTHTPAVGG